MSYRYIIAVLTALAAPFLGGPVLADEGMWTFDNLPLKHSQGPVRLRALEGMDRTPAVVGRPVQQRRLGLVRLGRRPGDDEPSRRRRHAAEDQHEGEGLLQGRLLRQVAVRGGEGAGPRAERARRDRGRHRIVSTRPCPRGMDDAQASVARRGVMAKIEKESQEKTGLRSDVVTLYQGGRYSLYTYKKYTDVRLVFAPEFDIAFFGGDPDNFEFPRYDLDVCFFRAYEDGKPARPRHHLTWSRDGREGGRPDVRRRPSGSDEPALLGRTPRVSARQELPPAPRHAPRAREVPPRLRPARGGAGAAVEGGSLQRPEQPEGARGRTQGADATGRSWTASVRTRRRSGAESGAMSRSRTRTARPGRRSPRPRRSPTRSASSSQSTRRATGWSRNSSTSRGRSSGSPRRRASRTRTGSTSFATRPGVARAGAVLDRADLSRARDRQARARLRVLEEGPAR